MNTTLLLAELSGHGRWDFDPHIWWHWLVYIAVLVGGACLKHPPKSDKSEGDKSDRSEPVRLQQGEVGPYLRQLAEETKAEDQSDR